MPLKLVMPVARSSAMTGPSSAALLLACALLASDPARLAAGVMQCFGMIRPGWLRRKDSGTVRRRQAGARQPAPAAALSIMEAKPTVVNGEPRSLTKTKGEDALSRSSRCTSDNRKLWVAQQSSCFLRMLCKDLQNSYEQTILRLVF
jgi:hypothetical protein